MAWVRKRGDSWQVLWRDPGGKQRSRSFRKKVDADRARRSIEADMDRGTWLDHAKGRQPLAGFAASWEASRDPALAQSTIDRDHSYLKRQVLPYFGRTPVAAITTADVRAWLNGDLGHLAPSTRAKALQLLRSVLDHAREAQAVAVNVASDVRPPRNASKALRQPQVLTEWQVAELLDAAETVDESQAGVVWLMARGGLRIGEALAVKRSDIEGDTLTVQRSMSRSEGVKAPKSQAGVRTLTMPADLAARLHRHLTEQPAHIGGWLFTGRQGAMLDYTRWRTRRWLPITDLAGLPGANPHDLRHTTATRLVQVDGFGPAQLMAYLGHSDARTSLKLYTHLTAADLPAPSVLMAGDASKYQLP